MYGRDSVTKLRYSQKNDSDNECESMKGHVYKCLSARSQSGQQTATHHELEFTAVARKVLDSHITS